MAAQQVSTARNHRRSPRVARRPVRWAWGLLLAGLLTSPSLATVTCAPVFSDHLVLQRELPVRIWGQADDGETVTVQFQGQAVATTAKDGAWAVRLAPLKPNGADNLVVSGDRNTVIVRDVLVGDVWLCSGQSNMALPLARTIGGPAAVNGATNRRLRLLKVPRRHHDQPTAELRARWVECRPDTAAEFSAVAYYFARALQPAVDVPIGLIDASYGGTPAESWLSAEGFNRSGSDELVTVYQRGLAAYDPAVRRDTKAHADWQRLVAAARRDKKPPPFEPDEDAKRIPAVVYNAMIAPLAPYSLRGVLWYQGEANAPRARLYRSMLAALIRDWRAAFRAPELPFLLVQLPACAVSGGVEGDWAELREAQLLTHLAEPRSALVVTCDLGESDTLHPLRKAPVGERLALAARAVCFGEKVAFSGPLYQSMSVDGQRVRLQFAHAVQGLVSRGGPLTGFLVAGRDGRFQAAEAVIENDQVLVWSSQVPQPAAVRYAWADNPEANLANGAGLPASPFRTDDWPRPEPKR